MRVALLSPLYESVPPKMYGGTERIVHNLSRGLTQAGHDVTVFASADSAVAGNLASVVDEAFRLSRRKIEDPCAYNFKMLAMAAERANDFEVIHNHNDYWMFPLAKMISTPIITTTHGRLDQRDTAEAYLRYRDGLFVSISDSQRRPLPDLTWLRTIYHGLDIDSFRYYPEPGKYLAFLGRIDPNKRPDLAIQIAKRAGVPLKIAAKIEGPVQQQYYDQMVKPHVDGKFIEYVGEISESEKCDFLGNALALCFPIDWPEPFGLVVIESLACGTPVLARPCGSISEILEDGVTGYCSLDASVLADRVHHLKRISRSSCRQWAEKRFGLKRMTEDYLHVYRSVIEFSATDRRRRNFLYSVERVADGNS